MLRELQVINGKNIAADFKAKTTMKTGMAVVKDYTTKEAKFPTTGTADNLFLVNKERIPTGINTARTDFSDYDEEFVDVKVGEFIKLPKYTDGEIIATDAVGTDAKKPTRGKVLMADTDGTWIDAASTVASRYLYADDYIDNGHALIKIQILDTPIKNA
ncbi:hypothetical protein [Anaerovorax sp. IOR16]|uniref:hypothetical protein n=1 Tax=Anaerovorax sp. IOR16 TaxID=2773458 RepID=UPI0019D07521|nr:hypothetical protein [Anaerovorax sp. IOR16]